MLRSLFAALRRPLFAAALCGGVVAPWSMIHVARADFAVNDFNSADEVASWNFETWSTATATATWDPTVDSLGNPNSGSMKIVIDFDAANNKNDANFTRAFSPSLDASPATLFIADVLVAEESPDTPWGDEGYLQLAARNGDNWDWITQLGSNIDSDGQWRAFDIGPVAPINDLRGLTFQLWGGGAQALQGRTTIWLDNIHFLGDFPDPTVPGDTDGDRDVDLDDLNNVRNNFGTDNPPAGDTDADGDVDLDDLNAVRNNFGAAGSQSVPEPASVWLTLAGLSALGAMRLRQR